MDIMKMGAFLQQLRREKSLTQDQLGERLHVSGKTVSRWETGMYMPPVEALLALSELYGLTINELVAGQRLTPETLPIQAEKNLAAVMKENEVFQLEERKAYWRRKWHREHLAVFILLFALAIGVQYAGAVFKRTEINAIGSILTVTAVGFLVNRRDGYVEHHLYDE